jgi:hypothetical protein
LEHFKKSPVKVDLGAQRGYIHWYIEGTALGLFNLKVALFNETYLNALERRDSRNASEIQPSSIENVIAFGAKVDRIVAEPSE